MKRKYKKYSVRMVNMFLRKRGIDPSELKEEAVVAAAKLSKKNREKIERFINDGKQVLVYVKKNKIVVRDANIELNFEKPELREKALKNRIASDVSVATGKKVAAHRGSWLKKPSSTAPKTLEPAA